MNSGATATSAKPPSMQKAATRSPAFDRGAVRGRAHDARDLRAGHERRIGLELVLAAGLQDLGEGDAGDVDVDDDAAAGREHVGRLGVR